MHRLARWVSIVGHPFITATIMLVGLVTQRSGLTAALRMGAIFVVVAVVPMTVLMVREVRRGRWEHVDASNRGERRTLYIAGMAVTLIWLAYMAIANPQSRMPRSVIVVLMILLGCALLLRWTKISLHVLFAAMAASALALAGSAIGWAVAAFVPLLMWSRLHLGRHKPFEVLLGAAIGAATGYLILVV